MSALTIPLTRGLVAVVDECDFDRLAALRWTATNSPRLSPRAKHYWREGGKVRSLFMHRLIVQAPDGLVVDHINGDGLDNRRANLRVCTASQNNCNRASGRSTGRYRGVTAGEGGSSRFYAHITVERRRIRLGAFSTAEEAARAYDAAAREMHGEFARLNFENGIPQ